MKNNTYVSIQSWMRTELNLSGNDLLVYAIIYGFSQDGQSKFNGSLQYLADWCGATKQGIQKNLKNLLDKGLIIKEESMHGNIKYCKYSCIPCNSVVYHETEFNETIQHSCINNIDNNKISINNIISKDIIQEKKPKNTSLYQKCVDEINAYTKNIGLINALTDYLTIRLKMTEKKLYGVNQWRGMINKLDSLAADDSSRIEIVNTAIERGWASFFAPSKSFNKSDNIFSEHNEVVSERRENKFSGESF